MSSAVASRSGARIATIDGLRALGLILVFAFHTWEFAGSPQIPLISSVIGQNIRPDFFVVLTGFVLYMPFARDLSRARTFTTSLYLTRRLRRIVLPYYASLVYAIVLPQLLVLLMRVADVEGHEHAQPLPTWGDIVTHFTFTYLFFGDYWASLNGSLWTMSLEMQLYLLFPLALFAASRWGLRGIAAIIGASVLFRVGVALWAPQDTQFLWGATGVGRLMEFAAGMLGALVAFRYRERLTRGHLGGLVVGVIGGYATATLPQLQHTLFPLRELGLATMFGSLLVLVLATPALARAFASRPLAFIGYRSYSLFLIHQPTA